MEVDEGSIDLGASRMKRYSSGGAALDAVLQSELYYCPPA